MKPTTKPNVLQHAAAGELDVYFLRQWVQGVKKCYYIPGWKLLGHPPGYYGTPGVHVMCDMYILDASYNTIDVRPSAHGLLVGNRSKVRGC